MPKFGEDDRIVEAVSFGEGDAIATVERPINVYGGITDPNRFDPEAGEQYNKSLLDLSDKFEAPIDAIEREYRRYHNDDEISKASQDVWQELQDLQKTYPISGVGIARESAKGVVRFLERDIGGTVGGIFYEWIGDFIAYGGGVIEDVAKIGSKNPDMLHNIHAQAIIATGENISRTGKAAREEWAARAETGWEKFDPDLRKTDPVSYGAGRISEGVTSSAMFVLAAYLSGGSTVAPTIANSGIKINKALALLSSLSAAGGYQHAKEQYPEKENFLWTTTHGLADGMIEYVMESTFLEGVGRNLKWAGPIESVEELFTGLLQNTRAGILENTAKGMSAYDASKKAMADALDQAPWEVAAGFIGGYGVAGGASLTELVQRSKQIKEEGKVSPEVQEIMNRRAEQIEAIIQKGGVGALQKLQAEVKEGKAELAVEAGEKTEAEVEEFEKEVAGEAIRPTEPKPAVEKPAPEVKVAKKPEITPPAEAVKPEIERKPLPVQEVTEKKPQEPKKVKMPEIAAGGVPIEPPGLTRAEMEHLGKREQTALKAGQRRGLPVGYKKGYQEAALSGRRALGKLRTDILISKKSREDVRIAIQRFVPKEERGRYLTRLSRVKDAKGVAKITGEIEKFIDDFEHRSAVRDFKKFVSTTYKKYNRGEVKLGKLSKSAREQIGKVFKEYDAVALSEAKAEDLQAHKEHIQKVAGSISRAMREWENLDEQGLDVLQLPNRRITELDRLEKISIKELSTEDIQYIQDELQSILTNEDRKAQIRQNIRSEYAHTYVTKAAGEVSDRGKTIRGAAKAPGTVQKFFGVSQANLRTLVRGATTGEAVATEEFLVDKIYESKRIADEVHKEWFVYAQEQFDKIGLPDSFTKDFYSDIKITLGGKKVTVPKYVLLNLWLNSEADGNLKRLLTAREHQITVKGKTTYIGKIKLEELQEALSQMPEEWKRIGETMFKVNREKNAPAINETALWERGYPIAVYEKYFPFPRKMRNIPEGHRTEIQQAMENRGRYQRRTGGNLPHIIKDPMTEFLNGLQLDSQYHAMTLALQDAKTLLADNKWRTRMDRTGNKPFVDAIIKMYQRGEGMSTDRSIADILGGKFLATMGKGTLSLRPTGAFIQTASLSAAYSVIDSRHFDSRYIPTPAKANALMDKDATMWWRWKARQFDYVIGSSAAENAVGKFLTGKDKMTDAMLKHYTWGDQWAVLKIWDAANNQIATTTEFARNTDEFDEAASILFHRAMETQPQWDVWHRSLFTSEPGAFERSFALFMSARNAQYNVLLQARDDFSKDRIDKTTYGMRVGDIVEANLKVAVLRKIFRQVVKYTTLGILLGIGKRDEEEVKRYVKKDLERQAKQLPTETVFNMVGLSVYGQIIATMTDQAIRGFSGKWSRTKFGDVRTGSVITDFIIDLGQITWSMGKFGQDLALQTRYASPSDKKFGQLVWKDSGVEVVNDLMEVISQLTGLPYAGPRSDIVWPVKAAVKGTDEDSLYKEQVAEFNKKKKKAKQEAIKREVKKGRLPRKKE